jgi:hypothetical protein
LRATEWQNDRAAGERYDTPPWMLFPFTKNTRLSDTGDK